MTPVTFLARLRGRLRTVLFADGLARTLTVALAAVLTAIAADHLWWLPPEVRLALLLGAGILVLAQVRNRLWRPLRCDLGDHALAGLAERRLPGLEGRLLTAIEGLPLGAPDLAILETSLRAEAARSLVPAPRLPRNLAFAGLLVVVAAAGTWLQPDLASTGLRRLLAPFGGTQWGRSCSLSGEVERTVVAADQPVRLQVRRSHPLPTFEAPLRLWWSPEGGGASEERILPGLRGPRWTHSLALPPGRHLLHLTSADSLPLVLPVRVVVRPRLERVEAVFVPPAYSGRPIQRSATLDASLLAGTRVEFSLGFATEADRPVLQCSATAITPGGATVLELRRTDGRFHGTCIALEPGELLVTAADADGIGSDPPARFRISVIPDRPPTASLAGPRRKETVTANAVVAIELAAEDDLGLVAMGLEAAVGGSATSVLLGPLACEGRTSARIRTEVEVGRLAASGGGITLTGWGRDGNTVSGPGLGRSDALLLQVVGEEELRRELDGLIDEARQRLRQGREEIAGGLASESRFAGGIRAAGLAAGRAGETLDEFVRRWRENRLGEEEAATAEQAGRLVAQRALPALGRAATAAGPAREADAALAEADRLLAGLRQEGDLARLLGHLVAQQQALNEEARGFVRSYLTRSLDTAGRAQQGNLALRQRELGDQVAEIERRVLASSGQALAGARSLLREKGPAELLRQAAVDLGGSERRPQAVEAQRSALDILQRLLEQLRGSEATVDLGRRLIQLATELDAQVRTLDAGADPRPLAQTQRDIAARTATAAQEAASRDPQAGRDARAGAESANSAAAAMASGDRPRAAGDARAAAALLREAANRLEGKDAAKPPKEGKEPAEQTPAQQLLALLRELRRLQAGILADSGLLQARIGSAPLDFDAQRTVAELAKRQGDVLLRLQEDALRKVEKLPLAAFPLQRVEAAMDAAWKHLLRPALGERGLRLERIALAELTRFLALVEGMPASKGGQDGGGAGGGGGDEGKDRPPLPPAVLVAILADLQEELAWATAGRRPYDLAGGQEGLAKGIEALAGAFRPGSRFQMLAERARRSAASAAYRLGQQDRGAGVRDEQAASLAALRRLVAELNPQGDGDGDQPPPPRDGSSPTPPPGQDPQHGAQGSQAKDGQQAGGKPATGVQADRASHGLMELPPAQREMLRQAAELGLTPRQVEIFRAYLQNLEERP